MLQDDNMIEAIATVRNDIFNLLPLVISRVDCVVPGVSCASARFRLGELRDSSGSKSSHL